MATKFNINKTDKNFDPTFQTAKIRSLDQKISQYSQSMTSLGDVG